MSDALRLAVSFNLQPVEDKDASLREGRPVFKDVEYVEIHVPGDPTNVPHRPVTDEDRVRFKPIYDAWKAGQKDVHNGQPLKEWPGIRPAEVKSLAHSNIHTVEQLAALNEEAISRVGPVRHLVERAKAYLERSRSEAPVAALEAKNRTLEAQVAAMQEQLAALRASPSHVAGGDTEPSEDAKGRGKGRGKSKEE